MGSRVGPASQARRAPPARAPARKGARPVADSAVLEARVTERMGFEPLARALARRTGKPREVADRAAAAVVREARRMRVSPSLLAGVLLTENRRLDSTAVSSQGAVGLMQVMPLHAGSYGCVSTELREVDANICHGARILRTLLARSSSVRMALTRYNGCLGGTRTPRCRRYVARVLRHASSVRREILRIAAREGIHPGRDSATGTGGWISSSSTSLRRTR